MRFFIYLLLFGAILYFLSTWGRRGTQTKPSLPNPSRPRHPFRSKPNPREVWVQVFETASLDEARRLQARIQEEEVACIVYEQGKKDIHGNTLKGIGIAVPKTATRLAQGIISRMSI